MLRNRKYFPDEKQHLFEAHNPLPRLRISKIVSLINILCFYEPPQIENAISNTFSCAGLNMISSYSALNFKPGIVIESMPLVQTAYLEK